MEQCKVESYSRTEQRLRQSILNQADLGNQLCPHPCMQDHLSPLILVLFTGSPTQDHLRRITFHLSSSSSSSQDHPHRITFAGIPLSSILILVAGSPPVQSKLSHITLNRINIAVVNKTKSRNILVRCKSNAFGEGSEDKFRRIDQRAIT